METPRRKDDYAYSRYQGTPVNCRVFHADGQFAARFRFRWTALAIVAFAGALACGTEITEAGGGATGTWILATANGKALPYLQFTGVATGNVYVTDDTLVVTSGGSFTEHGTRKTGASPSSLLFSDTYVYTGSYTAVSNSLTFAFQGGASGSGLLSGDQLSVTFNGAAFVYQRTSALASP